MSSPETFGGADLTQDDFLGGALSLVQPKNGYRAGVDPVLLAASVAAKSGETLLDLGCGVGTAALCVARRVSEVQVAGLEVQEAYAALARKNAEHNGIALEVVTGDLAHMPEPLKARQFDHVIANPPYFDRSKSTPSDQSNREHALGEDTPLSEWVRHAAKRVAPGGWVTFIHRVDRMPALLADFKMHLGSLELLPFAPRLGARPRLFLLRGRKGGRAEFCLHSPWVLHEGVAHDGDRESYTPSTVSVLRDGEFLPFS